MRETKYRAYDKEAECFVYTDKPQDDYFFEFDRNELKAFRIVEHPGSIHEPPHPTSEELEPVQQYTGLKDKNGKEIYESDIIQYGETRYIVQYNFSRYMMYDPEFPGVDSFGMPLIGPSFSRNKMKDIEIIGNIYESPEITA